MAQHHGAACDGILDAAHDELFTEFDRALVAKRDHLGEVVAGIDVQQRKGEFTRAKGLFGQAQQHAGILAAGEQQHRAFALGGDLAQDVDGFGFKPVEVGTVQGSRGCVHGQAAGVGAVWSWWLALTLVCRPHSRLLLCSHHQRPARMSSPGRMARVQGSQPIEG